MCRPDPRSAQLPLQLNPSSTTNQSLLKLFYRSNLMWIESSLRRANEQTNRLLNPSSPTNQSLWKCLCGSCMRTEQPDITLTLKTNIKAMEYCTRQSCITLTDGQLAHKSKRINRYQHFGCCALGKCLHHTETSD